MLRDELYKLAAEFYKQNLWYRMDDLEIFGATLEDGTVAYCSVQGLDGGEDFALKVFVGADGLNSWRHSNYRYAATNDNENFLRTVSQEGLVCEFVEREDLTDEELAEMKDFSRRNKIYFRKRFSCPRFFKAVPMEDLNFLESPADEKILLQALRAAIEVGKKYPDNLPKKIKFSEKYPVRRKIPVLTWIGDKFSWAMQNLPPLRFMTYPQAKLTAADAKKLLAAPKTETYHCEIFALPGGKLYRGKLKISVLLMALNLSEETDLKIPPAIDYLTKPEKLTAKVAKKFLEQGVPKKIFVRNERTYIFLEKFCEQAGIELCEAEEIPQLDEVQEQLISKFQPQFNDEPEIPEDIMRELLKESGQNPDEGIDFEKLFRHLFGMK